MTLRQNNVAIYCTDSEMQDYLLLKADPCCSFYITFVDSRASFKAPPKKVSSEVNLLQVIRTRAVSEDETRLLL